MPRPNQGGSRISRNEEADSSSRSMFGADSLLFRMLPMDLKRVPSICGRSDQPYASDVATVVAAASENASTAIPPARRQRAAAPRPNPAYVNAVHGSAAMSPRQQTPAKQIVWGGRERPQSTRH